VAASKLPSAPPRTFKLGKAVIDRLSLLRDTPRSPGFHPSELHRLCPVYHFFMEKARAGLGSNDPQPHFEFLLKVLEAKAKIFHPRLKLEFEVGDAIHQMLQYHLGAIGVLWGVWQCPICKTTTKAGYMPRVTIDGIGGVPVQDAAPCYGCNGVNRRQRNPWIYLEPRVRDEEWNVSGMCDGDLRIARHGVRAALEIKSINDFGWAEGKHPKWQDVAVEEGWTPPPGWIPPEPSAGRELPYPHHITQASTYAAFMGVDWLYFIYVNKNQVSKWKEFLVPADKVALAEARAKMASANKGLEMNRPPIEARTCADPREKAARECPAASLCFPDHRPAASFWDAGADTKVIMGGPS